MKKLLLSSAILATFALFSACGDDSSSGPEEESSSSIEEEDESSSSVEEEGKSSAADKKSSSSEAKKGDSSSSEKTTSSSSEAESSSSIAEESSSSNVIASSSGAKQSSSSEEDSSSSEESSSSANGSSSSVVDAVCYGEYGAEYTCVTTRYLNQDMLDTNGYGEFVDTRDKKVYKTVEICGEDKSLCQTWMAQNLNYYYNEGTAKSYCYDEDLDNCAKYGRLYLWSAAMDSAEVFSSSGKGCGDGKTCSVSGTVRGVCPAGWHLPTYAEWDTLITNVGGENVAGRMLKSEEGWNYYSESTKGIDYYGFSALPAGYRDLDGNFNNAGNIADFWSSSELYSCYAYGMDLNYDIEDAYLNNYDKNNVAFSVRCLKDN